MSDNFSNKDYSEYFSKIEQSLGKESHLPEIKEEAFPTVEKNIKTKKREKKSSKAKPFRNILIFLLIAAIGIFAWQVALRSTPSSTADNTVSDVKKDKKVKKLFADNTDNSVIIGEDITTPNIIIIDLKKNEVVASKDADIICYPASTTKIMTLLVAVENLTDLDDTFTMSYEITDPLYIAEATVAGFAAGEEITVKDMLYGAILPSGADATMGLACKISGSEEKFVELMNEKAVELGLKNTHYTNSSGLYDQNHYSTAEDIAVILRAAMDNPLCKTILSTYKYTTSPTPQHPEGIPLASTLFSYMYGTEPETATILGGKTGYITESGYCIAAYGDGLSGREYICVTLGSANRNVAIMEQIDLFATYAK